MSCGVTMLGERYIKSWNSVPHLFVLSSGEAELSVVINCSCETIGILQLAENLWMKLEGKVLLCSSAALGVVWRKGA